MKSTAASDEPAAGLPLPRRPFAVSFLLVTALLVASDLWTKCFMFDRFPPAHQVSSHPLLRNWLAVHTVWNTGIPWGVFSGRTSILAIVSAIAVVFIVWVFYRRSRNGNPLYCFGLALILGGAAGNLYDRAQLGAVRDWIEFVPRLPIIGQWPIFNLADSGICVGATMVFLAVSFGAEARK